MLDLLCADACSDKTAAMAQKIKDSLSKGRNCLVIVPDQFSFEYDKMLYKHLGAKDFNKLTTGGFNRICELIGRKHGGFAGENADENLAVILMFLAIKRLRHECGALYYKKAYDKGSFIGKMIALVGELRSSGVSPEMLSAAAAKDTGSMLSKKLTDISKLYSYYMQELESRGLSDNSDGVLRAVDISMKSGHFANTDIFIDSFHSFSYDELRLIRVMLSQADSVTVGLMIGSGANANSPLTPFAEPIKTLSQLKEIAKELSINVTYSQASSYPEITPEISVINERIFLSSQKVLDKSKNVRIIKSSDIYEEAEYVCSEIIRLTREQELEFDDCAVLIRDPAENKAALSSVFERYEIPVFFECPELITQYSFVMYFEGLIKCVLGKKYSTENIMRVIKSRLSNCYEYEASMLEEYCTEWNVDGDMWLCDFTAKDKHIPDDSKYLELINGIRKKIIEPFERFKAACEDATAGQISEALYKLLDEVELSQKSYSMIAASMNGDDDMKIAARQFRQLWELAVSCISAVFRNIPDEVLSLRQYYELIRTMFSNITVSAPPQRLSCVIVADSSHSRLTSKRVVFVMNCNDGVFPSDVMSDSLFSDREKQRLALEGVELPRGIKERIAHERLVCYNALTASRERLYLLWHETDSKGSRLRRSSILSSVDSMLGGKTEIRANEMPIDFYCPTAKSAYTKYLERCHDKSDITSSLKEALSSDPEYAARIERLFDAANRKPFSLDRNHAQQLFNRDNINLSATRLETYYKCPFMYFCKYGLKISPPTVNKIDPRNRGSFVHSCLEGILSKTLPDGSVVYDEDFKSLSDDKLKEKIHDYFKQYVALELGGDFGKTKRFDFISKRWEESAFYVVKNLRDELINTLFKPVGFEYSLSKNEGGSILSITSPGKYTINVYGSIDRVDIYEHTDEEGNTCKYIRIIDYKTGNKDLKLEELYNGLNLQMLIYLLALTSSENEFTKDGEVSPAGVLYMPAVHIDADSESDKVYNKGLNGDLEKTLGEYRDKKFRRFGLIVDNEINQKAMDTAKNRFLKFSVDKNTKKPEKYGSSLMLTKEEIEAFEEFAKEKLIEAADKLCDGRIEADPLYTVKNPNKDRGTPCSWCDYKGVCRNAFAKNHRLVDKEIDKKAMLAHIEKIRKGAD